MCKNAFFVDKTLARRKSSKIKVFHRFVCPRPLVSVAPVMFREFAEKP